MDESGVVAIAESVAQLSSRRRAVRSLGAAGIGSVFGRVLLGQDGSEAKKKHKKRKRKKKCKGLKGHSAAPNFPFPQHVSYAPDSIKPNSFSPDELDDHVREAYDRWKKSFLVRVNCDRSGERLFRIAFSRSGDDRKVTVSEGQGYGMIIVVTMAGYDDEAQEIFDGLWRFRLAHPSEIDERLMDWNVPEGEGDDSAFDGDADIAYALLLANAQWGNSDPIRYRDEALMVIAGIWDSTIGPSSKLPMLGDWVDPDGDDYNQNTPRTSDFMPGHFRAFGTADPNNDWDAVVSACQNVINELQTEFSPSTGLLPDFAVLGANGFEPAPPNFLGEGPNTGFYNYNAGRDPWRIGTDALLSVDATSKAQALKIAQWANTVTGGQAGLIKAGYTLNGTPLGTYFTTFFAAPIGVAAMLGGLALQPWLNAIYGAVYKVQEDYYEDTVTLLCMLVMTGNFWDPS